MPYFHVEEMVALLIAYLFGSISSAIIVCRLIGLPDPRLQGSGNPGATNVLRLGGKRAAIIVLLGDALKGMVPVWLAIAYGFSPLILGGVAFAAFLGHLYPIFFRFQGGKGVATAFGCWVALAWPVGLSLFAVWLLTAIIFRYSSLAALLAALVGPVSAYFFTNSFYALTAAAMCLLLIYRHTSNIKKLLAGKEDKLGKKKL